MSSHSSQESAASTSDLNEPGCESLDNAKQTRQPDESLPGIGQESHAQKMSPGLMPDGSQVMAFRSTEGLDFTVLINESPTLKVGSGLGIPSPPAIFTLSAEASPAKTSQLPESEPALPGKDQDSSMTQHESQTLFSDQGDGCSLRMFPDSFHPTEAEISESFSRRWPTSGFTTSPGELWTADTSECHNGGGAYSSLPGVLEATVPERFYLSQKAAAGILRRAAKRGRELPAALGSALRELSEMGPASGDGKSAPKMPQAASSTQEAA